MTLTRSVLDRWLHRGACAIAAVFLVTALVQQWLDPLDYPPTVFWTWVALGVCVWVWALADALRNREIPWGLRAVVVVAIGAGLALEPGDEGRGVREPRVEELHRDRRAKGDVASHPDRAHAAAGKRRLEPVFTGDQRAW